MTLALPAAAALAGALSGPSLRAAIFAHSVPYDLPLRTRCPGCRHPLPRPWWRARLPVTGRCPACRRRIGPAVGVVEACTAATLAVLAWRSPDLAIFTATGWLAAHGIILSFVDITVHRLPDRLTLPAVAGCGGVLALDALATGHPGRLATAAAGALLAGLVYLIQMVARPGAMGLGDAKVASICGLALGWWGLTAVFTGLAATVLLFAATAVTLLATRRITRHQAIAHGPAILLGALIAYSIYAPNP
jgi:leader peptidase (prepilin peptidase)/N-methyltransferase